MQVSVIIPTYNREHFLKKTIESILKQTFKDFELIIVDNYSTDNTEKIIGSYDDKRIRYFKHQNNGIIAVNRNFAIKHAKGELIAFCDDDDLWLPEKLEQQVIAFEQDHELGLVCTNGFSFDEKRIRKQFQKTKDHYITFNELLIDNTVACCSVMVRRKILDDIGVFDESRELLTAEDYHLWLRIAKQHKVKYLGTPLVKYRVHAGTFQSTFLSGVKPLEVMRIVYKRLFDAKIIDSTIYKNLCERINHRIYILKIGQGDQSVSIEKILETKMNIFGKSKVILVYLLSRLKILKPTIRIVRKFQ